MTPLISKAVTLTVDDLTLTIMDGKLMWDPSETPWPRVRWLIDHSLEILGERSGNLLAARELGDAQQKARKR